MPNLIVFESVEDSRSNLAKDEDTVQIQWSETPPHLDQVVSMGGIEKRWKIVDLAAYHPTTLDPTVTTVYVAIVNREDMDLLPKESWYCHSHPPEAIHVLLSEVYKPELSLVWDCRNEPPRIGEGLFEGVDTGIPSSEFSTFIKPLPPEWFIDRFDTYLPEGKAPYAMYLGWCSRIRELAVA